MERADIPYKFEKLDVWRLAVRLIKLVYNRAARLPRTEKYGLGDQLRRSAVSVALNIAEGRAADTDAEFRRFLGIALRSLVEVVAALKLCAELGLPGCDSDAETYSLCDELEAKLRKLRQKLAGATRRPA